MHERGLPTLQPILHHAWTRKEFTNLPEDPSLEEHLDQPYLSPGTCLDLLSSARDGLETSILVARPPNDRRSKDPILWEGKSRIRPETFRGWFGRRLPRVSAPSFRVLLQRASHFFIVHPSDEPSYVFPLPQFARLGVSHTVLERVLDAPVFIAAEGSYARQAWVPSLRVFSTYDGNRYGHSTRKLFYNHEGNAVNVELMAREVLARLGYQAVPPAVLTRLFTALASQPPSDFRPDSWPQAYLGGRLSPFARVIRARRRIEDLKTRGAHAGLLEALEAYAKRPWNQEAARPPDHLPLIGRYLSRSRLPAFIDAIGEDRLIGLFQAFLKGHRAVSADWFAYREGSRRAFPCEVKSRGDTLRPSQKESILDCQRLGLFDYRLLELHHTVNAAERLGEEARRLLMAATRHG